MLRAAVCLVLGLSTLAVQAEVIELEGTVKSVDAEARTISIERKTTKGERVKTLDVARKAGDISGLAEGQAVSITYDTDLRIVAKVTPKSGSAPAVSDEKQSPPIDPATVQRLTPEDARRLTATADLLLSLPRLRELSEESARELATYRHKSKTVSYTVQVPVSEEKIATFTVMVPYDEEKTSTYTVMVPAEEKVRADGTKYTAKESRSEERTRTYTVRKCRPEERTRTYTVTKMVPETRTCKCPLALQIDGMSSLEPRCLAELAKHVGNLHLNGLKALSREQAQSLAAHKGGVLALDGLISLDAKTAEVLAAHEGGLTLNGLGTLSPESAKALVSHTGDLALDGVKDLTDDLADAVVAHKGLMSLKGVTKTSDKAKQILAGWAVELPPEIRAEWKKEQK
jgi:hypothetical protein